MFKVDFIWVNREQKSFEWFWGLLNHIEKELLDETKSTERLIDMHLFMTSAQSKTDMKGLGLQLALDLLHQTDNKDLITGLQTRTKAGRPDWQQVVHGPHMLTLKKKQPTFKTHIYIF